jgi:hypothetical protein
LDVDVNLYVNVVPTVDGDIEVSVNDGSTRSTQTFTPS